MAHPSNEELRIGDRIAGRYEILAIVGQGSMGVVYKCRHDILGRVVAIKTLRLRELASDDRSQKRFEREARLASRLDHPNLIGVHDFGYTASGDPYLVMDFVSGTTLFDIMKRERYLIAERVVNLYSQVCEGLFHAHQRGVIHRDLKPANILVVKNENGPETVKIVDLGVAKIVQGEEAEEAEAITMTGEVCGSPIYLSPEQCMYQELDPRTDIYSLGVCMYESLMGVPPLRGATVYDTIYMHVHEMPRPFSAIQGGNPDVPRKLEEIIFRCLAKQPNDRYETMMQLKHELIGSLKSQSETGVKVLPPELLFGGGGPGAATPKKTSGEVPRPGADVSAQQAKIGKKTISDIPIAPLGDSSQQVPIPGQVREPKQPAQPSKRSAAPPADKAASGSSAASSKTGAKKSEGRSRAPGAKREQQTPEGGIIERIGLKQVVIIATGVSVIFGLSIGLGFAYFLSNQHRNDDVASTAATTPPPAAAIKSNISPPTPPLPVSVEKLPEGRPEPAKPPVNRTVAKKDPKVASNQSKVPAANKKPKDVRYSTNDLASLLPDEPPINSGQGSQNKYFSIVHNAPNPRALNHGMQRMPAQRMPMMPMNQMPMNQMPMGGAMNSAQALQKLKGNSFIQRMKEFAASQGMPIQGMAPPPQQQTPPSELWRQGGSLLQSPEGRNPTSGNNAEKAIALCNEATLLCTNKQFGAAVQKLDSAYKMDPNNSQVKQMYAFALNSHALELNDQHRYADAVETEKRAVNLSPDKELYHRNLHNFSQNLETLGQ